MQFSTALVAVLATLALASPIEHSHKKVVKRAPIFTTQKYDDISISGGTAGTAKEDALGVFSALNGVDLATLDPADIEFLGSVNKICNDAEKGAYNTAIAAASGDEATALQNGKIQNKVLKLTATMFRLQAEAAQGKDVAADMAKEQKKLDNNINLDTAAAGQPATKLTFDASTA